MAGAELRALPTMALVSAVVVMVAVGSADGLWLANLHNGVLALAFALVGAYVLGQRPGHPEGRLFLATGVVEAVVYLGRQVARDGDASGWWAWVGVWPVALGVGLTTLSVVCFPDGRLPSPGWRWPMRAATAVVAGCALLSALWPVEHGAAGVRAEHPFDLPGGDAAATVWQAVAHPLYAALQVLWVVAIIARWRRSGPVVRLQLAWLLLAAGLSVVALLGGLLVQGTPRVGLLAVSLVPVAAGWAIVHGQQVTTYRALSWMSRRAGTAESLPTALARAIAQGLDAPSATVWMGPTEDLRAIGVWPDGDADVAPVRLEDLGASASLVARVVARDGVPVGAVSAARPPEATTSAQARLLDDLASQAALVIEQVDLAEVVARHRRAGHLEGLTPREQEVLELMARGLSNAAICAELHLSVKTVEPAVGAIFTKLGLYADSASNRRVLAVLHYLRGRDDLAGQI